LTHLQDISLGSSSPLWCIGAPKSSVIAPEWCVAFAGSLRHGRDMLAERVAQNIRRVRESRGWSLEKVGKRCEPPTSYQQISRLEEGDRRLTFDWVERIAKALDVDPFVLISGEDQPEQPVFTLGEQVANEVARTLARVALDGEEPESGTVQALALILQELTATFSAHPQSYRDPAIARPVLDLASRRYAPAAS
jgi:transcriptional regulator with XRE-family HTH domain